MLLLQHAVTVADMSHNAASSFEVDTPALPERSELIEQIMRSTEDDRLVLPYLHATAGSAELLAATGRLLADTTSPFPLASPLAAWAKPGCPYNDDWRSSAVWPTQSLWSELEFLRLLLGYTPPDGIRQHHITNKAGTDVRTEPRISSVQRANNRAESSHRCSMEPDHLEVVFQVLSPDTDLPEGRDLLQWCCSYSELEHLRLLCIESV